MRQYSVDLEFDPITDDPTQYVTEDGTMMWDVNDVFACDWKDIDCQSKAIMQAKEQSPTHDVVTLFDGSDAVIIASMGKVTYIK